MCLARKLWMGTCWIRMNLGNEVSHLGNSHILAKIQVWDCSWMVIRWRSSRVKRIIVVTSFSITALQGINLITLGQFYSEALIIDIWTQICLCDCRSLCIDPPWFPGHAEMREKAHTIATGRGLCKDPTWPILHIASHPRYGGSKPAPPAHQIMALFQICLLSLPMICPRVCGVNYPHLLPHHFHNSSPLHNTSW